MSYKEQSPNPPWFGQFQQVTQKLEGFLDGLPNSIHNIKDLFQLMAKTQHFAEALSLKPKKKLVQDQIGIRKMYANWDLVDIQRNWSCEFADAYHAFDKAKSDVLALEASLDSVYNLFHFWIGYLNQPKARRLKATNLQEDAVLFYYALLKEVEVARKNRRQIHPYVHGLMKQLMVRLRDEAPEWFKK